MIGGAVGLDLNAELVALALGRPPTPRREPTLSTPIANLCFYPRQPGMLVGVRGIEKIAKLPGVAAVDGPDVPCRLSADDEAGPVNVITPGGGAPEEVLAGHPQGEGPPGGGHRRGGGGGGEGGARARRRGAPP